MELGNAPDRMRLLADVSTSGGFMSSSRTTLGRGHDGATPHYHRTSAEMFCMLDGELEILAGEDIVTARTGDFLLVPPDTAHAFGATSRSAADVLIVFTPGIERFEYFRLIDRVRRGLTSPHEIFETQERFDNHFIESAAWAAARSQTS